MPDLITTAKGIAGGLPLSAVTGRAEMMAAAHPGGLGGTYGGSPVACAAALAALRCYTEQDLAGRARAVEAIILDELSVLRDDPRIGEIRGRGAMIGIELVGADGRPDADLTARITAAVHAQGVVLLTCGTYGNVIRLLPPLSIPDELLREGLAVLREAVRSV